MTNSIYDSPDDLPPPGTEALIQLTETTAGNTIIDMALESASGTVFQASGKQRVTVGSNGSVKGDTYGLHLKGVGSTVLNDGKIGQIATMESDFTTDVGIRFSGAGLGSVTNLQTIKGVTGIEIASTSTAAKLELLNSGTIETTGLAIIGGKGGDRIVNTGTIKTTANTTGAVVLDLGSGEDLYDGRLGTIVGLIKLGDDNDIAYGGSGSETFSGGKGSNVIDGGAGDDLFILGDGYNTINGGSGIDTVDYSSTTWISTASSGFTINLTSGSAYGNLHTDTLANIEHIIGSDRADTITGNFLANSIKGGDGDDILDGGSGDDTLDGGSGNNTVRFTGSTAATVELTNLQAQTTGYGLDKLINIRNLEGGSGGDKFTGDEHSNRLDGNSGNDILKGLAGNDTLQGDAGNDTLEGGAGDDTLEGGIGTNTAVFSGPLDNYKIETVANGIMITDKTGQDGTDLLKDIRFAKFGDNQTIALVNSNPTIISPSSANVAESAAIGTTIATLSGYDPDGDSLTFSLVSDADGLFGISNGKLVVKKTLDFETASQHAVTIKALDGWGGELTKTFTIKVGNILETTPLTLYGTAKAEQLTGEAGNDRLFGLGEKDTLFGEAGNDTLNGGAGSDTLVGGAGNDVFLFDRKPSVKSNLDYIQDFVPKDDVIHLSRKIFSKIAKGTLSSKAFVTGDHFKDKDDRILYFKKQGALFYDPDGTGSAKAIQFASVTKNLKITHKDFFIF